MPFSVPLILTLSKMKLYPKPTSLGRARNLSHLLSARLGFYLVFCGLVGNVLDKKPQIEYFTFNNK